MLSEIIGKPAMLEQAAEECVEMAHACLKLARYFRGENKVYKSPGEIYANLAEEIADVHICIEEILSAGIISHEAIDSEIMKKDERMIQRLMEEKED